MHCTYNANINTMCIKYYINQSLRDFVHQLLLLFSTQIKTLFNKSINVFFKALFSKLTIMRFFFKIKSAIQYYTFILYMNKFIICQKNSTPSTKRKIAKKKLLYVKL